MSTTPEPKPPPHTVATVDGIQALIGLELGPSSWWTATQDRIDEFAETTGDHQWIHVDQERARTTDAGTTIAHGLLTLSVGPGLASEIIDFDVTMGFNYGYERVRFPASLPSGSRVRVWVTVTAVDEVAGGIQVTTRQRFEREDHAKPVCVADSVALLVP
jgi:acyl dehydratase